MRSEIKDNDLVVFLEGQVDTSNAEEVGKEIDIIRNTNPGGFLILDAKDLRYISSAGLRQILRLKKANRDFKIINVNNDIYEIFDMTGFSEMMDIEKAYRKFSVDGCEVLGEGSNGIVYRINPDTIIKVYKNSDALDDIKRERELARTALVMGVNTAIPYDVVMVGDYYGAIFELINCKSLTKWTLEDPEHEDEYVKVFVDMLKEVHNTDVKPGTLPSEKALALKWADYLKGVIDDERYQKVVKLISDVPESNKMIHGDYHGSNVHYNKKEAILIDMDTIACGNPIFDWACIYNAYEGFMLTEDDEGKHVLFKMSKEKCKQFFNKAVKLYFNTEDIEDLIYKFKIVGLTRVIRRTLRREPDNTKLIEEAKKQLLEAVDKVDSITL